MTLSTIENFRVEDLCIPYVIVKNSKSKHIRMCVDGQGLRLTIPHSISAGEIKKLLEQKGQWIADNYKKAIQIKKAAERIWRDGEQLLLKGNLHTIRLNEYPGRGVRILFRNDIFEAYIGKSIQAEAQPALLKAAFESWYEKAAAQILEERLKLYSQQIGVAYNQVRIKKQKTRWGSCSQKGNLNFNWRIIMSPQWVMDYVVVHELCHLKQLNHSAAFWTLVAQIIPDYKNAVKWLKENEKTLCI